MGRPGLTKNRKFPRLMRALQPTCKSFAEQVARGALELLWDTAYENGDDYLGDASDVEAAARWKGKPGALCRALVQAGGEGESGFIREISERPGHYVVHDLFDHAPAYVKKRMERELARVRKGKTLSDLRSEASAKSHEARGNQASASDGHLPANGNHLPASGQQTAASVLPPSPAPTPAPTPEKIPAAAQPVAVPAADEDDEPKASPEQKACRRAIAEAFAREFTARASGAAFRWGAGERKGIIALARTDENGGVDPGPGLGLLAVFVERMKTEPFYLKNFRPAFIASVINALRLPPVTRAVQHSRSGAPVNADTQSDHAADAAGRRA